MKTRTISPRTRVLSLFLIAALLLPTLVPAAFAWSGAPQVNAVNLYVGKAAMLSVNENLKIEDEGVTQEIPGSLLCDSMLYLPLAVLMEMGVALRAEEDPETGDVSAQIDYMDYINCWPIFPRSQTFSSTTLKEDFQTNLFAVFVDGTQIVQKGKNITYNNKEYPASIWVKDNLYLPINVILQALGIEFFWPDKSTFVVPENNTQNGKIGIVNFKKDPANYYGQFTDVPSAAWYAGPVKAAVEYGVMTGTGSTTFEPKRNISVAEAITIAARLHDTYYAGEHVFEAGEPWYQSYVDYALENAIISKAYPDYNTPISRGEFAILMANTFPLPFINEIEIGAIPDVPEGSSCYDAVYSLYCAGILSGTDEYGTFKPDAKITRAEVSTILSNMVDDTLRKKFTLAAPIYPDSVELPLTINVPIGTTQRIPAEVKPSNVNRDSTLTWKSSDPSIASVDSSGVVSGKKAGSVTITAVTANGKSASCLAQVRPMQEIDVWFAKLAMIHFKYQLKFPDTMQIHGIWADDFPADNGERHVVIYIYYSALNSMSVQRRGEYTAYFDMSGELIVDNFEDSSSPHTSDRPVDIGKVLD